MSTTYPHDRPMSPGEARELSGEEPFVPVYARNRRTTRGRKGGVKTWMILAPIGVLVLGGAAAALIMGGGDDIAPAPLAEPAATPPVLSAPPVVAEAAPVTAPAPVEATPAPAATVDRTRAPVRRSAAPARASAAVPAPATRAEAPARTGPQPYTATLNTAPTPAQAPVIVIQPAD